MSRFTFPDGRWVELRPMYVADELAFDDLAQAGTDLETARDGLSSSVDRLQAAATDEEKEAAMAEAVERVATFQRAYSERMRSVAGRMETACTATSWDGPLIERVTSAELYQLQRRWRTATEDVALPPV